MESRSYPVCRENGLIESGRCLPERHVENHRPASQLTLTTMAGSGFWRFQGFPDPRTTHSPTRRTEGSSTLIRDGKLSAR